MLAEEKLAEAAASDPALLETAERNTRSMLEGMMRGLGFEHVTVRFEQPRSELASRRQRPVARLARPAREPAGTRGSAGSPA